MRFTELLLLVSCMSPLLFVNGLQALQPTIKNNLLRRDALIPGLLVPLQFCVIGFNICWNIFCCPPDWNCCTDGSCCQPTSYCFAASNGIIGCCPNGTTCDGPVSTPTPLTSSEAFTATLTTLSGGPTQFVDNQIIDVSVLNSQIIWRGKWFLGQSSCDPSDVSMFTSTNSSFSYFIYNQTARYYKYYFSVVNFNTEMDVLLNGTLVEHDYGTLNCTYSKVTSQSYAPLDEKVRYTQNFTIVVKRDNGYKGPWLMEVNRLLIELQNSSGPATATSTSAAGRAQPYRPLLLPSSIFFAAVISILRL